MKQRFLGEAAKTQEVSNFKNTVSNMKRLAGRTVGDAEIQEVEAKLTPVELVDVDGQVGVKVNKRVIVVVDVSRIHTTTTTMHRLG